MEIGNSLKSIIWVLSLIISAFVGGVSSIMLLDSRYITKNGSKVPIDFLTRLETLEKKVSKLESSEIPVGTVIASTLEFGKFTIDYNPDNVKVTDTKRVLWVPADGRAVPGSKYQSLTGKGDAPDLRGVFLRGMNEFYSFGRKDKVNDNQADPDKKRAVGEFQEDSFQSHLHKHSHTFPVSPAKYRDEQAAAIGNRTEASKYADTDIYNEDKEHENNFETSGRQATETRPKNSAVYYYIKIN